MSLTLTAILSASGLFLGMLFLLEVGRRRGVARLARDTEDEHKGFGAIEGAVFALLGLLIAFTFSGAASRFDARRQLVAEETNAIGTAYLRLDMLPAETQPEMRNLFRQYLDSRLEAFRDVGDTAATNAAYSQSVRLQNEIWSKAVSACRRPDAPAQAAMLVLPALNQMIDITTTRLVATMTHPPLIIFLLLGVISLISSLLAGFGMAGSKARSLLHMFIFAVILSLTIYVIIDLEFPRRGLIRVATADQTLVDLRESMRQTYDSGSR
jgi:hypothetical protein